MKVAFTGQAYTKNSWFSTLGTKINKVSNKIHQLTLRGGANFIVASPDVCTILESIPQFTVNAGKDFGVRSRCNFISVHYLTDILCTKILT